MPIYRHFAVPFFASCDAFETFSDWTLWRIFPCYFSKALPYWRRQKMNSNIQKIDILCNVTKKKFARHFENHRCMTWRHTGSDQWTNVYPRDGPSLLSSSEKTAMAYLFNIKCISLPRKSGNSPKVLWVNCLPLFIFSGWLDVKFAIFLTLCDFIFHGCFNEIINKFIICFSLLLIFI